MADAPRSPGTTMGEVTVFALLPRAGEDERWFRVDCREEDDARYRERPEWRTLDAEAYTAVTEVLASGAARSHTLRWRGRDYRRTWSLDPPYYEDLALPGERFLWFYPMRESRMVFRAPALELARALRSETRWLAGQLARVPEAARADLERRLSAGADALARAVARLVSLEMSEQSG
ncbi:MAG: hypothetical protein H6713_30075 [Myxococcales bacterium]|nr:hypothetical protein [Myxococcales bacterium]